MPTMPDMVRLAGRKLVGVEAPPGGRVMRMSGEVVSITRNSVVIAQLSAIGKALPRMPCTAKPPPPSLIS